MTREDAIQILSTRDAHGVLCGYTSGVTEALDMAIEALKSKTEGDLISRQEALAEFIDGRDVFDIMECIEQLPSEEAVHKPDYSYEADMVRRIKEALSAEAVQEWIPCSERLPNEDGEYLVARGEFIYVYSYGIPLMPMNERNRRRGWYESTSEGDFYMDVDAWMPLPEPYKGGEDE